MAIPNNSLSSVLLTAHFLEPDDRENFLLMDLELGGVGLNDPSQGLRVQTWTLRYFPASGDMVIDAPNSLPTILFTRSNITEISLAFDQNMNAFVAFVESGDAKFWWFDTQVSMTVFTNLPAGSLTPRCCLDDKRETQTGSSDIILAYALNAKLYFRQQRDRYTIQYLLQDPFVDPTFGLPAVLKRVGMNKVNRLQFLCDLLNPFDPECV